MSEFFDDLGKKISDAATEFGKKTEEVIEVQKVKSDIRSLRRGNERDYIDIGKAICDKYQQGEVMDSDVAALCEAIEKRLEQIKDLEAEISRIKGEE